MTNKSPYEQGYFPPNPTKTTLFMRTFLPWQIVRFVYINYKMFRIIFRKH